MSVTSGFFNSLNHDRRYNAKQFSELFDGIINDGVFANIGVAFAINADSGVTINIGAGKAWFNSAWVYNDALLPKTLEGSEVVLDRIDAVVIEVDHNESVRMGDIKIVKGTPSSSPKRPTMANEVNKHQYPLAYVYRKAGSTEITQADITNMVGTSECPYITGILQVQNIDNIVAQWNAQWNQWYAAKISETDTDASELLADMKSEFDIWFNDVQALLDDDVATALAAQVAVLQGKFDDLAREGSVYDTIEDSNLDVILGSDGTSIEGKTVFTSSGGSSILKPRDIGAVAVDGTTPMEGAFNMNSHRILNVSEPEAEADAANALYVKKVASRTTTRPNLLDNPWFTVNQKGQAVYTNTNENNDNLNIMDRWKIQFHGTTFTPGENILASTAGNIAQLNQWIEYDTAKRWVGKTMTLSVLLDNPDGAEVGIMLRDRVRWSHLLPSVDSFTGSGILSTTGVFGEVNDGEVSQFSITIPANTSVKILAVKLEVGSVSTLENDAPPDYASELLKCQQYFQRFSSGTQTYFVFALGYMQSAKSCRFFLPLNVPMRTKPTIKISDGLYLNYGQGSTRVALSDFSVNNRLPNQVFLSASTASNVTVGTVGEVMTTTGTDVVIELSAEL